MTVLSEEQLGAALRDLSEWGSILIRELDHAKQVIEAAPVDCELLCRTDLDMWEVRELRRPRKNAPTPLQRG